MSRWGNDGLPQRDTFVLRPLSCEERSRGEVAALRLLNKAVLAEVVVIRSGVAQMQALHHREADGANERIFPVLALVDDLAGASLVALGRTMRMDPA